MLLTDVGLSSPIIDSAVSSIDQLIDCGDYEAAAKTLGDSARNHHSLNQLGVCLLRLGRSSEAVRVFRSFVLEHNSTSIRPDLPAFYKRNFATALALSGIPSGALEVLQESGDTEALYAVRLRSAILQWAEKLPLFQKLDWRLMRIEPRNAPITLQFVPGELENDVELPRTPETPRPRTTQRLAA